MIIRDKHLHIQIPCQNRQIKEVRKMFKEFSVGLPFDEEELANLGLVVNEGVANAIDHGAANDSSMVIDIDLWVKSNYLFIIIKDYGGKLFNPEYFDRIAMKKEWGRGGRGIYLMKAIMDNVSFVFSPSKFTTLYLSKKLR